MITQYHRPSSLDEALALVASPQTIPLGGGTRLVAHQREEDLAVVDLQNLGLSGITRTEDAVTIGSMTVLQEIVDSADVPDLIRDLAHREAPNIVRNAVTIGGIVAAPDPESEFVAGLLAFEAIVAVARGDTSSEHLISEVLADPQLIEGAIITAVSVAVTGKAAAFRTARTPADRPIVAVVARNTASGETLLAASGVASGPILIELDQLSSLEPPDDFRGSSDYRKHLARVLAGRAVASIGLST